MPSSDRAACCRISALSLHAALPFLQSMQAFRCAEFTGPGPAIAEYLRGAGPVTVSEACLAVAAPVTGKVITMTNNRWRFDTGQLAQDRKSTRLNSSHVRISYAVF